MKLLLASDLNKSLNLSNSCIPKTHTHTLHTNTHLLLNVTFKSSKHISVCLQSLLDVYFVCWFAKSLLCDTEYVVGSSVRLCSLAKWVFDVKNICLCSNYGLFTSASSSARLFSLLFLPVEEVVVRDELAYDGLSFRICAIKVFLSFVFAQGKLYGCHRCCILKQIFILLMLRKTENKMEV